MENQDCYIVAIGASAGGSEAIIDFFSHIPQKTGMAFIIVRHLKRDYVSQFQSILKRYTPLRIVTIRGGEKITPDTIYLMPETHKLCIRNRTLHLIERPKSEIINNAIDAFFESLAKDAGDKAIGVILSGYMSDGVRGAKMIEDYGGMMMVQDPESAQVKTMPLEVILKDSPDYILTPQEMPRMLIDFIKHKKAYK